MLHRELGTHSMAHTTWDSYTSAHKTYKYYDLPVPVMYPEADQGEDTVSPVTSTTTTVGSSTVADATTVAFTTPRASPSSWKAKHHAKGKAGTGTSNPEDDITICVRRRRTSFSSSPGWFASIDDWSVQTQNVPNSKCNLLPPIPHRSTTGTFWTVGYS